MSAVIWLIYNVLDLYRWAVIIYTIIAMGISFNVINAYQPAIRKINMALGQLIEPALKPIRKVIPPLGGLDISPIILLLGIGFLQHLIASPF